MMMLEILITSSVVELLSVTRYLVGISRLQWQFSIIRNAFRGQQQWLGGIKGEIILVEGVL
jgi:hypothetical protein